MKTTRIIRTLGLDTFVLTVDKALIKPHTILNLSVKVIFAFWLNTVPVTIHQKDETSMSVWLQNKTLCSISGQGFLKKATLII